MSYKALAVAWDTEGLSSGEKLVFISLADQANHDGLCWPSQKKTASRTGLTRQTVNQHIRSLEDRGLLSKMERSRYRMVYQIKMSGNPTPEMSDIPTPDVGKSDTRCRESRHPSEPSLNRQRINGHSDVRFEDFWKTYPRHEAKAKALKAWKSKSLDKKADEIITAVQTFKAHHPNWRPNAKGETFIPHPTTFLNGERWNDEIGKNGGRTFA